MKPETHKTELQQLFKDEKLNIIEIAGTNEVKTNVKRELSRLEIGHCFSLGLAGIKRSGEGLSLTFDLTKAMLNFQTT